MKKIISEQEVSVIEENNIIFQQEKTSKGKVLKQGISDEFKYKVDNRILKMKDNLQDIWETCSNDEFDYLFNSDYRDDIKDYLRGKGKKHEWCVCCKANVFRKWGLSIEDIFKYTSPTDELIFLNIYQNNKLLPNNYHPNSFTYNNKTSKEAHNQLEKIIDESLSFEDYVQKLNIWADLHIQNGRNSLPSELIRN